MAPKIGAHAGLLVLDSSCWIEFFNDSARANLFSAAVAKPEQLVVPILTIYEVTKKLRRELSPTIAGYAESMMRRGHVVEVDLSLTRTAITYDLPLADSLIYATAQAHGAVLWTQDAHFDGLPGVKYFAKAA
jgi:PIN domain nuclease of toxin-antitoxin system